MRPDRRGNVADGVVKILLVGMSLNWDSLGVYIPVYLTRVVKQRWKM